MRVAICKLKSRSPYSQSRFHNTDKKNKENHADYEERTWREKVSVDDNDNVIITPLAFANSLKEAAKYLSLQIPGKGKSLYTKHFEAGVMVSEPLTLPVKKNETKEEWVHVPSDGKRGGTTRVSKCFPRIDNWEGTVKYYIFDDIITEEVFEQVLRGSGQFIGIGRFRPKNWGYYGQFAVEDIKWEEL